MSVITVGSQLSDLTAKGRKAVNEHLKANGLNMNRLMTEIGNALTTATVSNGQLWYKEANMFAKSIARKHKVSLSVAAGVISAVSPRMNWPRNKEIAEKVLANFRDHNEKSAVDAAKAIGGCLSSNMAIAIRIARGEAISDVLTGIKRRSFYNNIVAPGKTNDVTVDTWMQRSAMRASVISGGMDLDDSIKFLAGRKAATNGVGAGYIAIAEAVRNVAKRLGLSPDTVQAAYWIHASGSINGGHAGSSALPTTF